MEQDAEGVTPSSCGGPDSIAGKVLFFFVEVLHFGAL